MHSKLLAFLLLSSLVWVSGTAHAQGEHAAFEDSRTLELVDQMKEIIQRAEKGRKIDPAVTNQLRELIRRYDWPWRVRLLADDFSDGEYTSNPVWTVSRGNFWVTRGLGLRTVVGAQSLIGSRSPERWRKLSAVGILGGIFKEVSEPVSEVPHFRDVGVRSQISSRLALGNAFAIKVRLISREKPAAGSRLEFGPFRGSDQDWGFRIAYKPGQRSPIELVRIAPGRSAIVASFDGLADLEDGRAHDFDWRRDREGNMLVLLNGNEVIRAVDRSLTDFFDGFTIANNGGNYTFERVEVFGADR